MKSTSDRTVAERSMVSALVPSSTSTGLWSSSFLHHNDVLRFTQPPPVPDLEEIPEFYRWLEAEDAPHVVLEYPWHPAWAVVRSYGAYQRRHHKPVKVVMQASGLRGPNVAWRNLLDLDPDGLLAGPGDFFVLHRDLANEEASLPPRRPLDERVLDHLARIQPAAEAAQRRLRRVWGDPTMRSDTLWVWDLEAVRARATN